MTSWHRSKPSQPLVARRARNNFTCFFGLPLCGIWDYLSQRLQLTETSNITCGMGIFTVSTINNGTAIILSASVRLLMLRFIDRWRSAFFAM